MLFQSLASKEEQRRYMSEAINAALNLIGEESTSPLASPAPAAGEFSMAPAFDNLNLNLPEA